MDRVSTNTSRWYYQMRSSLRKFWDWEIINVFYLHYDLLSCFLPNIYLLDIKLNSQFIFRWNFVCFVCTAKQICINRICLYAIKISFYLHSITSIFIIIFLKLYWYYFPVPTLTIRSCILPLKSLVDAASSWYRLKITVPW